MRQTKTSFAEVGQMGAKVRACQWKVVANSIVWRIGSSEREEMVEIEEGRGNGCRIGSRASGVRSVRT